MTTATAIADTSVYVWPTAGRLASTPEDQGMDSEVLADLVEYVAAIDGIDSVTVVRNGSVVLDTVMYPFPEATGHVIHSVTKSIIGTLIAIAIDRGLLAGVEIPVVEILSDAAPKTVDELKASMTVEHLLTMSAGLDCREPDTYMTEMVASGDWTRYLLTLPMVEEPGTRFQYCDGASHLLSAILTEATGMSAASFADEVLFEPLGITDYMWPAGPDGTSTGWGEIVLQPADMAKLGYLYLRGGAWDGDRVVSTDWITSPLGMTRLPSAWISPGGCSPHSDSRTPTHPSISRSDSTAASRGPGRGDSRWPPAGPGWTTTRSSSSTSSSTSSGEGPLRSPSATTPPAWSMRSW